VSVPVVKPVDSLRTLTEAPGRSWRLLSEITPEIEACVVCAATLLFIRIKHNISDLMNKFLSICDFFSFLNHKISADILLQNLLFINSILF